MDTLTTQAPVDRQQPEKLREAATRQPVEHSRVIESPPASESLPENHAAVLQLQRTAGNQAVHRALQSGGAACAGWRSAGNQALHHATPHLVQFQRRVALPHDPHEVEADRVADHMMSAPAGCTCGTGVPCQKCQHEGLSRRPASAAVRTPEVPHAVNSVIDGMRGHGLPLQPDLRAHFEPRFGRSFRDVRLHTTGKEAESARAVDATAYTVGPDIVFAPGRFDPHSKDGQRLLAHELTHVVQQGADAGAVLYRNGDPAPQTDPAKELAEREQKAFEAAGSFVGKPAVKVWFSSPKSPLTSPDTEQFSIAEVVKRPAGPSNRIGFDAPGPALVYATIIAGGVGAVVVVQDKLHFAARLAKGNKALTGGGLEPVESSLLTWALAPGLALGKKIAGAFRERNFIYRVDPDTPSIVGAAGKDGFVFPLGADLEPDPDRSRFQTDPSMPSAPDAESMRAIAGMAPESAKPGEPPPLMPDAVEIPAPQQRLFINSYFRARGQEALASNEVVAAKLTETFKPTTGGTVDHPGKGVSQGAQALIDSSRKLGVQFKVILDREAELAAQAWFIEERRVAVIAQGRSAPKENLTVTIGGESKPIDQWQQQIKGKQQEIARNKNRILSLSPLIAQLVEKERPESRLTYPTGGTPGRVPTVTGPNPYAESLLAKEATPQNDEAIRVAFLQNLDAVRQAIRRARSEMVGADVGFLLGMEGLRERVKADLGRMAAKNAGLKDQLDEMLKENAIKELAWDIGQVVIQVGLLFLPGGAFLSGAFGFAVAAEQMGEHLREWDVSKAAVDPASALVDQQQVEESLAVDTIMLAISALDMALGVNKTLSAMEDGGKAVKVPGAAIPKEEEAAATREFKFQDEFRKEPHELRIRPDGMFELCSNGCGIFQRRIRERIGKLPGGVPEGDLKIRTDGLLERAATTDAGSIKIQNEIDALPKPAADASAADRIAANRVKAPFLERQNALGAIQQDIEGELERIELEEARRFELKWEYEEPLGSSDTKIRESLDIKEEKDPKTGKVTKSAEVADFLGRNAEGRWKLAEFKGSDVDHAYEQLKNTYDALLAKEGPAAVKGKVDFEIHVDSTNYAALESPQGLGTSHYRVDPGGLLVYGEIPPFTRATIDGVGIEVTKP